VLAHAGASMPVRDAVDVRIVNEVKSKTASGKGVLGKPGIIDSPSAAGGWPQYKSAAAPADSDQDGMPDEWEKRHNMNATDPADRNRINAEGYTMLETYINGLVPQR